MRLSLNLNPRHIAVSLGLIAVLLALQSLYAEYVLANILGMESDTAPARLLDLFSVNLEESLPTWYSTINLFLAACLLGWIALTKRLHQEPFSRYWAGLAVIFLYLSMDEGAAIHESTSGPLQRAFDTTGFLEFGWLMLGIPLVILFGLLYLRFWLRLPPPTRALFALAGGLYIGGAVVIESISANQYALDGGSSFHYMMIATFEELCEMLGVVVLIYALLDYLARRDHLLAFQTQSQLPDFTAIRLRWPYSLGRTAAGFALILLIVNGGLLAWGIALRDLESGPAAPYHFYILVEELAGEDVTIAHFPGVFSPADSQTQRRAAALLAGFPTVQILTLPGLNASIALAGDAPVLTNDQVIELMNWIEETEYIFYDAATVRAITGLP
jgi:hypothetical protein